MPLVSPGYLLPDYVREEFGFQEGFAPANPALGASFKRVVPGAFYEILAFVRCLFTSSATVANRVVRLDILDQDGNKIASLASPNNHVASTGAGYRWSLALTSQFVSANGDVNLPLLPFALAPGWTIVLDANSLQAGDQFTLLGFVIQRYPTGLQPEKYRQVQIGEEAAIDSLLLSPPPLSSASASAGSPSGAPPPPSAPPAPPATVTPAPAPAPIGNAIGGPVIRE